ncbi:MAG: sigma-70 family RNA polymerase sigma factor [Archangium sp.]|nr:sigma-70 family RNA polymerase sigma factor [Archangium sp.]
MQVSEITDLPDGPDPLVEACREGQPGAFRALYDAHFDFAWRTARRLGLPEADVDDAVQDAFRIAWQQLDRFTWGRFTTWLYRIVANVVSERLRRKRVREFFGGIFGSAEKHDASLEARVEARQSLKLVEQALRKLSREKREAFALFEIEGLSHQEIAELTGARVETIRTRVHYARKDFEKLVAELGVTP